MAPETPPSQLAVQEWQLAVQAETTRLRAEVEALKAAPKGEIPRLQALKLLFPKASAKELMVLAKESMDINERDANLQSRKVGVPLFATFSVGSVGALTFFLQNASTGQDLAYATIFGGLTFFCLFMTAFFLGAPRAAIAFFARNAKEAATLPHGKSSEKNDDE